MNSLKDKLKKEQRKSATNNLIEKGLEFNGGLETLGSCHGERENFEDTSATSDLEECLAFYYETADPKFRFDVKVCTFEDVMLELSKARRSYEANAQGKNIWRQGLRKAGDYANEITPWLNFIPSDYGLSFLSAGLKIVFSIAQQNSNNREKILNAFEDIPELMLSAKEQEAQWKSAKLRKRATELYDTLARVLARLIFILNGTMSPNISLSKRASKFIKRLIASGYTAKSIDGLLAEVQTQAQRFEKALQRVRDDLVIQTGESVLRTEHKVDNIEEALRGYNTNISNLRNELRQEEKGIYIFNVIHQNLVYCQSNGSPDPFTTTPSPSPTVLSVTDLFNCLCASPQTSLADLRIVINDLPYCNFNDQMQAQQLFSSRQFTAWMATREAATFLVHGNFETPGPGRVTALSILCAMLVLHLHGNDDYVVLHYFCGLHGRPYQADPVAGPNGLIRCLIAQMLCTGHIFKLDFINTPWFAQSVQSHSLDMLCHTFSQLVVQLPPSTVVLCILDGVTEFESEEWWDDFSDVLLIFDRLGTNPAMRPIFKPLITTPFSRGLIDSSLQARYTLTLEPTDVSGVYAFSDRSMPDEFPSTSRLEYFSRRMQLNRADEDSEDSDEDSDEDD